jgi:hypothetical protein
MTVWRKPVRLSFLTSCSELSVGGRVPDRRQVVVSNVDHLAQQISISTLSPNAPEGFVIIVGLSVRLIGLARPNCTGISTVTTAIDK